MGAAASRDLDLGTRDGPRALDRASYEPHASHWSAKQGGSLSASSSSSSTNSLPKMVSDSDGDSSDGGGGGGARDGGARAAPRAAQFSWTLDLSASDAPAAAAAASTAPAQPPAAAAALLAAGAAEVARRGGAMSGELLLERVALSPSGAAAAAAGAGAHGGGAAAAAAAACQVMVGVQLPPPPPPPPAARGDNGMVQSGPQGCDGSAGGGGGGEVVRLAALDEVFAPPGIMATAAGAAGGAPLQRECLAGATVCGSVGRIQLPAHLLPASGAAPAAAAGPAPGAAAAPGGPAGGGGGAPCCITVTAAFHSLDLIPVLPHAPPPAAAPRRAAAAASAGAGAAPPPRAPAASARPTAAGAAPPLGAAPPPTASPRPAPAPAGAPPPLVLHQLSSRPRLLLIDGFWGADMCDALMATAAPRLTRSRVASGNETPSRTSWSHFFVRDGAAAPLIRGAEASIEALFAAPAVLGGRAPLAKTEALQVVKYHEGEFYEQHYDNRAGAPLARAATIIVYLADTEEGGATNFPRAVLSRAYDPSATAAPATAAAPAAAGAAAAAGRAALPPGVAAAAGGEPGIRVFPKQGRAIIFWSRRPDGSEDVSSIHAAEVVRGGDKWIATRWMKQAEGA
ncbi:MAG: hypothetical protein J3K34DRAFT_518266 [Monoraphidium minutum]|nr:MAG: hypothetical protein J3K34DRAFT_518266 [Monoraphidium minutum]